MIRRLGVLLPFLSGCSLGADVPVTEHVRVHPISQLKGVALGMSAAELRAVRTELSLARYEGYAESGPGHRITFGFSDPCSTDWQPEAECPVRGRLEYIAVEFGWETAEGQTLFVETWGEFFDDFAEPAHCVEWVSLGGRTVEAHWEDESGLWAKLRERRVPAASPDSARTSFWIGRGDHGHPSVAVPAECGGDGLQ